jgi:hypothetical protein
MAAPTNTSLTGEIGQLSVDDLFAPLPETARLGGPGPFVINLSVSSAPITLPVKGITGGQHVHVYQVQRMEDRRPRYRLRLGPFVNEDEADAVLKKVRDIYPGALTATADADDMRAIASLRAKADALRAPAEKPAESPQPAAKPAESSQPAAKPAPSSMPTASATPTASAAPTASAMPTAEKIPVLRVSAAVPTLSAPVPVLRQAQQLGKRMPIVETTPTASAKPAPPAKPATSAMPTAEPRGPVRAPAAAPTPSAPPVPRQAEQLSDHVLSLETTQTVRALTQPELEDDKASRWFVIQLSLAEGGFDPDTVPNLDIFSVYRLYSVAGIDQGRIVHALRLGFFTEEIAADAVASYLAAFYEKPIIKRVSAAERERFAQQTLEPRKDVGATGKHAAIEITSERFVREKRSGQASGK